MLTDKAIQAAKPRAWPYKLADGEGLTMLVNPNGSKLWRFRYRYEGREKMLGFGSYPDTTAKLAREKRDKARKHLAEGLDPSGARQAEKVARGNTFEAVAREWLPLQKERLAPATYAKAVWTLETLVSPIWVRDLSTRSEQPTCSKSSSVSKRAGSMRPLTALDRESVRFVDMPS